MNRSHLPLLLALLLGACGGTPEPTPTATEVPDSDGDSIPDGVDCDPFDGTIYEGAPEDGGTETQLSDNKDNDCDGTVDEGMLDIDDDLDGFSDDGTIGGEADCDDDNADRFPGNTEIPYDGVDQDCTGADLTDIDEDGFDAVEAEGDDCDDENPVIYPGAPEDGGNESQLHDDLDNDCDGAIDEGMRDIDDDGDGFTDIGGDCNDEDNSVYPGADEIPYDGIDQDCTLGDLTDVDDDGFDSDVVGGEDCDDNNDTIYGGAAELCDGLDNDCDGVVPENEAEESYYLDGDGDGFGDADTPTTLRLCDDHSGFVMDDQDCDDGDTSVYPGAEEVCDDKDTDCDPETDELDPIDYYADADADGVGSDADVITGNLCDTYPDRLPSGGDCDDTDEFIFPGSPELCDGKDNDCDPATLEGDEDADGDGAPVCGPDGETYDCDDSNANIAPSQPDWRDDRLDNNCDGDVDGVTQAHDLLPYFYGEEVNAILGESMDGGQDFGEDGYADLVIGAYKSDLEDSDAGRVYLMYGKSGIESGTVADNSVTIDGYGSSHRFGQQVRFVGDLNGDGIQDLAISAPREGTIAYKLGAVMLFFGDAIPLEAHTSAQTADVIIYNKADDRYFGTSLSGVGDVNGDGIDDLAIAAGGGRVVVYMGREIWPAEVFDGSDDTVPGPDLTVTGLKAGDYDEEIALAGADINGDGFNDLLVGAEKDGDSNQGACYVLNGREDFTALSGMPLADIAEVQFMGQGGNAVLGVSIDGGDLNGDGIDDLLVSSPGARPNVESAPSAGGSIYLFYGRPEGLIALDGIDSADVTFGGVTTNERAGSKVRIIPDVTGDPLQDFAVYATNTGGDGTLYVVGGQADGWQDADGDIALDAAAAILLKGAPGDLLGSGFAPLGNFLGGESGLAVSAPLAGNDIEDVGQVYLIAGRDEAPTPFPETPTPEAETPTPEAETATPEAETASPTPGS